MANTAHHTPSAVPDFYDLSEAAKADRAYWALDRASAGEALQTGDSAALLYAMGLVDRYAQALRAAGQRQANVQEGGAA